MPRYHPSLLILRGKPTRRRIRPRRGSLNNAVRDQRLSDLEWAEDRRAREAGRLTKAFTLINAVDYRVHTVAEEFRHIEAQAKLNAVKVAAIEAREVPGFGAEEKSKAFNLTNKNSEEIRDMQEQIRIIDSWMAHVDAELKRAKAQIVNLARAVGEDPDV